MRSFLGILQLILVVVILAAGFATTQWLSGLREHARPHIEIKERDLVVAAQMFDPISYRIYFETTGSVQSRAPISLVPQISGKITAVNDNLYPGGTFKKGDLLFQIEQADFEHDISRLKAELAQAKTEYDLAIAENKAAIAEWESLHPGQNNPQNIPPLVARTPQLNQAKAAMDGAKAQLDTALLNLKRTSFTLPFDGRITQTDVEIGQYVTAGSSLGQAYALEGIEIQMPLEDREFGWIREFGTPPDITIQTNLLGQDVKIPAKLKRLGAEFDPQTRLANVVLAPQGDLKDKLLPGMFVDIHVVGPVRENIWLLPIDALQEDNSIWKINDDMRIQRISPRIINITKDYVAMISDGKPVKVVIGPIPEASNGTKIRIKQDEI